MKPTASHVSTLLAALAIALTGCAGCQSSGGGGGTPSGLVLPKAATPAPAPAAKDKDKPKPPAPKTGIPVIAGPAAADQARAFVLALQAGRVDRKTLGEEFNFFLKDGAIAPAAARLKAYGEPTGAVVESIGERGGMEVSTTRLEFKTGALKVLMYRTPDGKIQQLFIQRG